MSEQIVKAVEAGKDASSGNVLETIGVKKSYKMGKITVHALRGIDLCVKSGEFVSIVGPSGSGKSTLMNLLGCLDVPTEGKVMLDGIDVSGMKESKLTEMRCKKIGYVFQKFYLLPFLTALENVELQARFAGIPEVHKKSLEALKLVGLEERAKHLPMEMSGGEQQRVAIARALVKSPKLLLADEPTGNLDTVTGDEVMATLKSLNSKGITILMVTHNSELAARTNRIIRVKDGLLEGA
ncbi:MAG TPA: ABC transporter ATP-binding protein [Methanocellaceae archaeon]